jgi:hypothetical protein
MHRAATILRWTRINTGFMLVAFLLTGALVVPIPNAMLDIFGSLAKLYESLGARTASAFSSQADVFSHILGRNALAALSYFVVGLVLQAPLALILSGAFYGLVAFLGPLTLGRAFGTNDWLLIAAEATAPIISASLASAFSSELHGVTPSLSG